MMRVRRTSHETWQIDVESTHEFSALVSAIELGLMIIDDPTPTEADVLLRGEVRPLLVHALTQLVESR